MWRGVYQSVARHDSIETSPSNPKGKGEPLSKEEVALLTEWIKQGAKYDKHWSYKQTELKRGTPLLIACLIISMVLPATFFDSGIKTASMT